MGGIGLPGGAVYIERWRLRGPRWETAVSLAGPAMNGLVAIILGLVLRFTSVGQTAVGPGLAFLALLQVSALVLNLIPVPPFDGYGANILRARAGRVLSESQQGDESLVSHFRTDGGSGLGRLVLWSHRRSGGFHRTSPSPD